MTIKQLAQALAYAKNKEVLTLAEGEIYIGAIGDADAEEDCYRAMIAAAPQSEQVESELVAWCLAYDDPNLKLRIHSNPTMCEAEIDAHVKGLNGALSKAPLYTTPQPDRTAELEAALKVARDGIDKFLVANDPTEFGCACDLSVGYLCGPCHADMQQEPLKIALAKINEVLK